MKTLLTGALMLLFTLPSFAAPNNITVGGFRPFTIPGNPTARQITRLFINTTEGIYNPFMVVRGIDSLGNKVVPALKTFLFNTPVIKEAVKEPTGTIDSISAPKPDKFYAIMALSLIGTPQAFQVIGTAAASDSNPQVKGMALRALTTTYYYEARQNRITPDKSVVGLLMNNLYDTTYVRSCGYSIAQIARAGLKRWTGVEYGQATSAKFRKMEEQRLGMSLAKYREEWWQKNSSRMTWNVKEGRFELK